MVVQAPLDETITVPVMAYFTASRLPFTAAISAGHQRTGQIEVLGYLGWNGKGQQSCIDGSGVATFVSNLCLQCHQQYLWLMSHKVDHGAVDILEVPMAMRRVGGGIVIC